MCYSRSVGSLCPFSISILRKSLQKEGDSLGKIDRTLSPGEKWGKVLNYSFEEKRSGHSVTTTGKVEIYKDPRGLLLDFNGGMYRYRLEKRESNLKPGTYRYYFLDPYSPTPSLCEKLYYLPGVCEFVPRSVLWSYGVLYTQQRKGKKARYFDPRKLPETRYRKTHYRGRVTPFWDKYQRLQEEEETRYIEFVVGNGFTSGLVPLDVEREVILDYCKHSGRKTIPRGGLYSGIRKSSGRRRKVRYRG